MNYGTLKEIIREYTENNQVHYITFTTTNNKMSYDKEHYTINFDKNDYIVVIRKDGNKDYIDISFISAVSTRNVEKIG